MKAGDKVICVEGDGSSLLKLWQEYTVTDVNYNGGITVSGLDGIWVPTRFKLADSLKNKPALKDSNPKEASGALGRKDDRGKVRMELLNDMPRAIKGVAEVLHWAVTEKKPTPYVPGSWQHVDNYYARYTGALMRHQNNIATNGQFAKDAETNLLDLKHLACDILILLELTLREQEIKP